LMTSEPFPCCRPNCSLNFKRGVVMQAANLGHIEAEKLLIFGGPYGKLEATQALFAKAEKIGIGSDYIICTGEIVSYCADPLETTYFLCDKNIHIIQGNCEQSLAEDSEECGCGFEEGTACDVLSKSWFSYCRSQINADIKEWFGSLPERLYFTFSGKSFAVVHGSPVNISEFVFASDPDEKLTAHIQKTEADCVIGGHSGLPFTKVIDDRCWHNAGVIGMPANDGTPRVWYSLISQSEGGIVFEHKALSYPAPAAQAKMEKEGLPDGYAQALTSGLWPSLDILPESEAQQTGFNLLEQKTEWKPS